MKKIQYVSKILVVLFSVLYVYMPIALLLYWLGAPVGLIRSWLGEGWASILSVDFISHIPVVMSPMTGVTKSLGLLVSLIPLLVNLMMLYYLIQLFKNYTQDSILSRQNVMYIKRIGWVLLFGQLLKPLHDALISMVLTWHNPICHRYISISVDKQNLAMIVCGVLIVLISWVMSEAYREQEINRLII